ncbi:hypothetical protein NQ317_001102 [Molorchus minor]|uniref:DNA-directed DNA polymerase n=1 Tax=Molorchus minor TaxID=1323400 RepID=A0ABQ9IWC9_9CUCU|nr:hypothetical protein NQ317_001102 [Molorchus minor]
MQRDTGKPETNNILFVFYDVETRQEKILDDGSLLYEPNLCVFKQCCDICIGEGVFTSVKNADCGYRVYLKLSSSVTGSRKFTYHISLTPKPTLTISASLPAVEYYTTDGMKGDREAFLKWYAVHKDNSFDMQRELLEYCISDVEILTAACLKFRQELMETVNVCPFTEACTIASTCNKVYRRNFLKPNTIGIIPRAGYSWKDSQSKNCYTVLNNKCEFLVSKSMDTVKKQDKCSNSMAAITMDAQLVLNSVERNPCTMNPQPQ